MLTGILGDELIWSAVLWDCCSSLQRVVRPFWIILVREHWYPALVCVCCVRRRLPLLQICGTAGLPLESVVSSRVRSITRVGDVSGGSKACATELVRRTSQIGFGAKTQESTKSEHGVHSRSY